MIKKLYACYNDEPFQQQYQPIIEESTAIQKYYTLHYFSKNNNIFNQIRYRTFSLMSP